LSQYLIFPWPLMIAAKVTGPLWSLDYHSLNHFQCTNHQPHLTSTCQSCCVVGSAHASAHNGDDMIRHMV